MADRTSDVMVAGLGAMGSAVADFLTRAGLRVLGLDRHRPPHALGSSHGRTRVIREAYFEHPSYVPLVRRAFTLWRELESRTGRELLRVTGALLLGGGESRAIQGSFRSAAEHGVSHERLSAAEIRRRFPALHPAGEMIGLLEPGAGALQVEASVAAQLQAARDGGATLRFDEPLLEWRARPGSVEVHTPSGTYAAAALVIAVGPWLPQLLPGLPLRVERQVQLWFEPHATPDHFRSPACPVFLCELESGELFYGLPDFGDGVKVARHHGGADAMVESVSREVTAADVQDIRRFLRLHLPGADGEPLDASVCLYTNTPDGHFLIDRHPDHPSVWLVSPCSGHGFKFAPVVGERVARWIVTGSPPSDLGLFAASRLLP